MVAGSTSFAAPRTVWASYWTLSDPASWAEAKRLAEERQGPIDLLVNNAGIGSYGTDLADIPPSAFARLAGINLCGTFYGIAAFAGDMRERRAGHILNTASIVGCAAKGGIGDYCATKAGVVGMTEALREEMGPYGVGVSVMYPAWSRRGSTKGPHLSKAR